MSGKRTKLMRLGAKGDQRRARKGLRELRQRKSGNPRPARRPLSVLSEEAMKRGDKVKAERRKITESFPLIPGGLRQEARWLPIENLRRIGAAMPF